MSKKTVVLAAFACDPNIPSEPTIGWSYLETWMNLAASHDDLEVLAVMNVRSKAATDARIISGGHASAPKVQVVGIELPRFLRFLENPYLTRAEYLAWNFYSRKYLKGLSPAREIVLARHVTFASELLPTPISVLRARAHTVWGPVGSSGVAEVFLIPPRHPRWRIQFAMQKVRDALSRIQSRRIARGVDQVLTTSPGLAADLAGVGVETAVFPNTRIESKFLDLIGDRRPMLDSTAANSNDGNLRLLCVGNLVYLKRFELAIATLTDPRMSTARLSIIGKPAPGKVNYLSKVAAELGVQDRVEFRGQLPQDEVVEAMLSADVLIHPSTREGGSGVVGEATAVGLPVVCFRGTGAAVVLEFSGAPGVQVDAKENQSVTPLTNAVLEAVALPRLSSKVWRTDRYFETESSLLIRALDVQKIRIP
jgi:glycosyltransferase involved in cell wall biosynthesis